MPCLLTKQYFCKCVYLECTRKIVLFHIIFGDCNKYIVTKSNFIEGKKKWPQLPNTLWSLKMTWVREIPLWSETWELLFTDTDNDYSWATNYYVLRQKKNLVAYMNVHTICTRKEEEQASKLFATKLFWVFAGKNCQRVNSGWDDINMQILILFTTVDRELNLMMLWTIWPWLYSRQWCFCYNVVATESDPYNNYYYRDFYDMHLRLR